jgi:hypothetical protein
MGLFDALRYDLSPGVEIWISALVEHGSHSVSHRSGVICDDIRGEGRRC